MTTAAQYVLANPKTGISNANDAAAEDPSNQQPVYRRVAAPLNGPAKFYGYFEGKHVTSDYFDKENERLRRDPALHARLQLGMRLYDDKLDVSVVGGAVKLPASQAVFQKRPELMVDLYPIKSKHFNLLWYNALQFPVRETDRDPTEFAESDKYDRDALRGIDASTLTIGIAPIAKVEWAMIGGKYQARAGGDAWTKLYSKPLYVDDSNGEGGSSVGLVAKGERMDDKPFEDRAMRYVHQESVALGWVPSLAPAVSFDLGAHIESRYIPRYYRGDTGNWEYTYDPERRSFWRTQIHVDLSHTWSLEHEMFVYRNGFFTADRIDEQSRFKNIIRIGAKL
jgi:hypothetical protein